MPANVCCSSVELRGYGTTNDWGATVDEDGNYCFASQAECALHVFITVSSRVFCSSVRMLFQPPS
jgi:hypothetical protein